jgi:hypothetical protein
MNSTRTVCSFCDAEILPLKAVLCESYEGDHSFYCSEACLQQCDPDRYRPIAVGDILESETIAFELDVRDARRRTLDDDYWMFNGDVGFYDFDREGCPYSLWVVVAKMDDLFYVVPWMGDDESKLTDNDHPDHVMLPFPVKVQWEWDEWWLEMKEISFGGEWNNTVGEFHALAGYGQWRSTEELNALRDSRMRHLLPGEADKVRRVIAGFIRGE